LGLVGENPGPPDAPHTGAAADSDPLAEQLVRAPAYAAGCGMTTFLFAFEDPAMPGAGGGSVRTHEINRRLAARGHDITVLTTRFPGCVDRVQDGVTYLHVGAGRGGNKWTRLLGYVRGLPFAARKVPADLVV